jgi:two-component sensor histidine kinase
LIKEVHHRVKNNLQLVSSLFSLQGRYFTDPVAKDSFEETQNRVLAIALVHEKLYQSSDLSRIDFGDYLTNLAATLLAGSELRDRVTARVDVPGFTLPISEAIPCGLMVNELLTNAIKHAFPDGRRGTIDIHMDAKAGRRQLTVSDDGAGLPADVDVRRSESLGWQLVTMLAKQLEVDIQVDLQGRTAFQLLFQKGV